jgi:hypothetical protein
MIAQKARMMTHLISLLKRQISTTGYLYQIDKILIDETLSKLDILTLEQGIKVCVEDEGMIVVYLPNKVEFTPIPLPSGMMYMADAIFEYEVGTGRIVKCRKHRERNPEEFSNV